MAASSSTGSAAGLATPPFDTVPTAAMSSRRSRPPSGENITVAKSTLVNSQQIPKGKTQIEKCHQELSDHKSFTPGSLDYLLDLLTDELPLPTVKIMPSSFLNVASMSIEPLYAPNKFLAPVYHGADQGHWTLVFVTQWRAVGSNRTYFKAHHYDSQSSKERNVIVQKKLEMWVERHHGKDRELKFELITGPSHDQRYMSGPFVVMAANEFAKFGTIKSNSQKWDDDPRKFIMDILNGKRPATSQLRRESSLFVADDTPTKQTEAPALATPALTPSTLSAKKGARPIPTYKNDCFARTPTPAPESPLEGRRRTGVSPFTKRLADRVTSKVGPLSSGLADDARSEPNSKRRRVEIEGPLTFKVNDKPSDIVTFLSELQLPAVASLQQESDKHIAELRNKEQKYEKDSQALGVSDEKYAQHEKDFSKFSGEYESLKTQVDEKEKAKQAYIAKLSEAPSEFKSLGLTDKELADILTTKFDTLISPLKGDLEGKSARKRKASEMLGSVGDERKALQVQVAAAMQEKLSADYEAQQAGEHEETMAILHDAAKKLKDCKDRWKESGKTGKWVSEFEERRRRRQKEGMM
ncbi:unnamed protein product [Fusarium langsethiae]|nr:unnamed protein product [Fusarium langsethiae]